MKKAVAAMFLAALAAAAMATEYTWKSSVATGKWSDPANWTGGDGTSCPGDGDSVVFGNADSDVSLAADVTVAGLTVSSVGTHAFRSDKTMTTRTLTGSVTMSGTGGGTLVLDSTSIPLI